jgi:BirA family transcriptional regulator, biotin operon repressor / biotin---[acetyl-CoA-carboxylase] ligase
VTDYQTAGRGRLTRRWEAPPQTALLASWVLPTRPLALFAAGVATAESCGAAVRLKWPNDLLLGEAKLGGMLAEQRRDRCVVGIGINLHWAPPGGARLGVDRDLLLDIVSERLEHWFGAPDEEILTAWRRRADTIGRAVRVQLADEVFEGVAEGIASDGALLVGGRRVATGDVIHLRPGSPPANLAVSPPPGP